jgi:cell wall-associated NlpC family hydrolase
VSLGSLLAGSEPLLQPGQEAVVGVAVATLWVSPDQVRPIDEPAIWVPSRPREWVESMSMDDRADLAGRTRSQLLLGERVIIDELRGGWTRVVALSQPCPGVDQRGCPGWLPTDQLSTLDGIHAAGVRVAARHRENESVQDLTGVWHVVVATATALRDDPDSALAVPGVTFGTRLMALGAPHDGWLPVAVPGRFEPAWAIEEDVAAVHLAPPTDNTEVLGWADRLRDVPYIPGGMSAYGVDASGFVHLVWRRFSVMLPRDARDQAAATAPIPLGTEQPGDLYVFASAAGEVDHVGFVTAAPSGDSRQMLHASPEQGQVVLEELSGEWSSSLAGARRISF